MVCGNQPEMGCVAMTASIDVESALISFVVAIICRCYLVSLRYLNGRGLPLSSCLTKLSIVIITGHHLRYSHDIKCALSMLVRPIMNCDGLLIRSSCRESLKDGISMAVET